MEDMTILVLEEYISIEHYKMYRDFKGISISKTSITNWTSNPRPVNRGNLSYRTNHPMSLKREKSSTLSKYKENIIGYMPFFTACQSDNY